jgi:hypothetical protein
MKRVKTGRGFVIYEFKDRCDENCSLQKSSLATEDAIWLGIDLQDASKRMHLTVEQVQELIPVLQKFVETGEI